MRPLHLCFWKGLGTNKEVVVVTDKSEEEAGGPSQESEECGQRHRCVAQALEDAAWPCRAGGLGKSLRDPMRGQARQHGRREPVNVATWVNREPACQQGGLF